MLSKTARVVFTGFLLNASVQFATIPTLCGQETTLDRVLSGNSPVDEREFSAGASQFEEKAGSTEPQSSGISITIDPKTGRLIIQSDDPAALDQLEEVMRVNRPPQRPYDVFEVKYARATWLTLNLEEYFEENDGDDDSPFRYFFGFDEPKKDEKRELGKRPPLRFIADNDTNSIVVTGADDGDIQTIRDLIKLWDVPEPKDEVDDARYIELVRVKYSKAESIAASLKETFRDLLSANDKAFQEGDDGESKRDSGGDSGGGFSFAYKGKLSIGVDVVTNSILVSAEGQTLSKIVLDLIKELDDQARTESEFAVATVPASVNGKSVKEALMRMLAQPKQPDKSKQQQQAEQQQMQQQQQQQQQESRGRSSNRPRGR